MVRWGWGEVVCVWQSCRTCRIRCYLWVDSVRMDLVSQELLVGVGGTPLPSYWNWMLSTPKRVCEPPSSPASAYSSLGQSYYSISLPHSDWLGRSTWPKQGIRIFPESYIDIGRQWLFKLGGFEVGAVDSCLSFLPSREILSENWIGTEAKRFWGRDKALVLAMKFLDLAVILFFFFRLRNFYWSIVTLQCCLVSCCTQSESVVCIHISTCF